MTDELKLDELQLEAVRLCVDKSKRIVSVTGAAGTGKTTVIRHMYEQLVKVGNPVIAAPTGKAARRIKEATGIDAMTIHKLLEYNRPGERDPKTGKPLDPTMPKRNDRNPLDYNIVIADEYAMVPNELHNNLLAALPSGSIVRMFGDVNQLAPIEPFVAKESDGSVAPSPFERMLERFPSVTLEHVYRQGDGSAVLQAADKIRKGHSVPVNQMVNDQFYCKITDKPVELLKQHVQLSLENGVSYRDIKNQIIVPTKKSWVGTHALNTMLRTVLNPNPVQMQQLPRHSWDKNSCAVGVGDKVVCTENTYDLRPYFERFYGWTDEMKPIPETYIPCPVTKMMLNGETGIILEILPSGAMEVDFGDRVVEIPSEYEEYWAKKDTVINVSPLRSIDLAYALTTHKCQGSEYDQVCYVLNKSTQFGQSRRNFYTGVTRAAKRAFVFTDQISLRTSLYKKG